MATAVANMSMSLDGFIADRSDGAGQLFGWYSGGDVAVPTADPRWTFRTSAASAGALRDARTSCGDLADQRRVRQAGRACRSWGRSPGCERLSPAGRAPYTQGP
jgi:hypothetical protein